MYIIKNTKYDIRKYLPITLVCKSYSKLLDANIKLSTSGLKLDISYIEEDEFNISGVYDKKILFLIKKTGENLEFGYVFFKLQEVLICDHIEKYYIFYKEECNEIENRENKLNKLGI